MNNRQLAEVFQTIADLMTIKGESTYRTLAYRKAADSILDLGRDVHEYWENDRLKEIPGVGEAIASKIDELLRTGELEFLHKLAEEVPIGLVDVLKVGDVGPKKAALFWQELGITTIDDLEKAASAGELSKLRGMGEKSEKRILDSIEALKRRATDRISIGEALPKAERLLTFLRQLPTVDKAEIGGSLRRYKETIGDIDIMVVPAKAEKTMNLEGTVANILKEIETEYKLPVSFSMLIYTGLEDPYFLWETVKDGVVLYIKPKLAIQTPQTVKPYALISYSYTGLTENEKKRLSRFLFEAKSGLKVDKSNKLEYIAPGVILLTPERSELVVEFFNELGLRYSLIKIWR